MKKLDNSFNKFKTESGVSQIFIIIIVALITAGLAGAGVWYWQQQEIKKIEDSYKTTGVSKPKTTPSPSPTTTTPNKTTGWKTYKNKRYGYSIKYPIEWLYAEEGQDRVGFAPTEEKLHKPGSDISSPISVIIFTNSETIQNWKEDTDYYDFQHTVTTLGGLEAFRRSGTNKENTKFPNWKWISVGAEKNGVLYIVAIYGLDSNPYQDIFDQMLSTFKFTD